jgi:hypothetical protein
MRRSRGQRFRHVARAGVLGAALACPRPVAADDCRLLRYTFQIASRPPGAVPAPPLDLPPQIAVWLEGADGTYLSTLMVTSAVALHGIGNRPGRSDLPSGPKFPYGSRPMALPVWAHARGQLYPAVRMEDGDDADLMGHEATSSPEPYFCRPMLANEVVDAVTCPSGLFRSAKGVFAPDGSTSYYPPRGDLLPALGQPCDPLFNERNGSCDQGDAPRYGLLDDVDAVAAATPAPDAPYSGTWVIPPALAADGAYALMVEVNKEFDGNASYGYPSSEGPLDSMYTLKFGFDGNVGQPSVVYRVPLALAIGGSAATTAAAGHGDPLGADGALVPPDGTLSTDPGTGEGRLDVIGGAAGPGRVQAEIDACPTPTCDTVAAPAPVEADVAPADIAATSAVVEIRQESDGSEPVLGYQLRYRLLPSWIAADPSEIPHWTPGPAAPAGTPGDVTRVTLDGLVPWSDYVVAIFARGACGVSQPTLVRFFTHRLDYRQLSGCFVVSAAFDEETVGVLRRERDRAARASGLAAAAADIYRRTAPPLAALLRRSDTARAVARTLLGPAVTIARAAGAAGP